MIKKTLILSTFIFLLTTTLAAGQITANFRDTVSGSVYASTAIKFFDSTTGGHLMRWHWVFGTGKPADTSKIQSPTFTYTASGTYSVKLVVYDSLGHIDSMTRTNYVTIKPKSLFVSTTPSGTANKLVSFTNTSLGGPLPLTSHYFTRYRWITSGTNTPGDTIATVSANFTYTLSGTHNVTLIVYDSLGNKDTLTKINYVTITPKAAFTSNPTNGCVSALHPLIVHFTDNTTGGKTSRWLWNFGTSNPGDTSNIKNPIWNYTNSGTYTVKEIIYDSLGNSDSTTKVITVSAQPIVRFNTSNPSDTLHHCAPYTVKFINSSDTSAGCTLNFTWYIDTAVKITHHLTDTAKYTFTQPGDYPITLTETESCNCGPSHLTQNAYIHIDSLTTPCFTTNDTAGCGAPFTVNFHNCSGNAVNYLWQFGDGTSDTTANPVHIYSLTNATGYTDSLTAYTVGGCPTTISKIHNIKVGHFNPGFQTYLLPTPTVATTIICIGTTLYLKDTTFGATKHRWRFSNTPSDTFNTTATLINHSWVTSGVYHVVDSSWNTTGCTGVATTDIFVAPNPIIDSITANHPYRCTSQDTVQYTSWVRDTTSHSVIWHFGEPSLGILDTAHSDSIHIYNTLGKYSPSIKVTDAYGCVSNATFTNFININPPYYAIKVVNDSGCLPVNVTYTDTVSQSGIVLPFYLDTIVYNDGSLNDTGINITGTHTYNHSGRYKMYNYFHLNSFVGGCSYFDSIIVSRGDTPILANMVKANVTDSICPQILKRFYDSCSNCSSGLWNIAGTVYRTLDTSIFFNSYGSKSVMYVANFNGCTDTVRGDSIYVWPPNVNFTVSIPKCSSHDSFLFTNNSAPPVGYTYHYTWFFGDGSQLTTTGTTNVSHVYSVDGTYTVSLVDSSLSPNPHNCFNAYSQVVYAYPVTRSDTNFYANKTLTCKNSPITFRGHLTSYDTLYKYYYWKFGDGTTSGNITNTDTTVHFYVSTGVYTPKLILTTRYGCWDSVTNQSITIETPYRGLNVNGSATSPVVPKTGCAYFTVNFHDSVTAFPGTTLAHRRWLFNTSPFVTGVNTPPTAGAPGSPFETTDTTIIFPVGLYHVVVIDSDNLGCFVTDTVQINSVKPHSYFTSNDTIACTHVAVHFHDTTTHVSKNWLFGDQTGLFTSASTDTSHIYTVNGLYSDTLITISDGTGGLPAGCRDTTVRTNYVQIGNTSVHAAYNFSGVSFAACPPLTIHTINTSSSVNSNYYKWKFGVDSSITTTTTSPFYTYNYPGTYTVTLIDSNATGCKDTTRNVVTIGGPTGTINSSPDTLCVNESEYFHVVSASLLPGIDTPFIWTIGYGSSISTDTTGLIISYPVAGTYHPYVIIHEASSNCSVTIYANDSIIVSPSPVIVLPTDTICKNSSITISATGAHTYSWSPSYGLSSTTIPSPIANPTVTTTYKVIGTTIHGCKDSVNTTVTVTPSPNAITGTKTVCTGNSTTLANSISGGIWTSQSTAIATVDPALGIVSGIASGTVTISYSIGNCTATAIVTVSAQPVPFTGITALCNNASITLSDITPGGTWSSANTGIATIGSTTGILTGISAGTANISYSINGCVNVQSVLINTRPTVSSIGLLPSTTVCYGTTVTLTGGSTAGTGALISYNWSGPNGYSVTNTGTTAAFTASTTAENGIYSLSVTYPGVGCTSVTHSTSSLTVNPLPTISGITVSDTQLCTGATLTLTAGSVTGTGSVTSYHYSGPGYNFYGLPVSTTLNPLPAGSGNYSVTVSYPGSGCTSLPAVTSQSITINPKPAVTSITPSTTQICIGSPLTLSSVVTGTGNLIAYNWSGPNGYSVTNLGTTAVFTTTTTAESGIYSLSVTYSGLGCTSAARASSNISVNFLPSISDVTTTTSDLCTGTTLTLIAGIVSGTGSPTYRWSGPNGFSISNSGPTATLTPTTTAASGVYSVYVSYPGTGCNSPVVSTASPVTVNALPVVSSLIPSTPILCTGTALTLSGTGTGSGTLISYNWTGPNGFSITNIGTSATFTPTTSAATGNYSLSLTYSGTGCTSIPVDTLITINPLPTLLGITPSTTTICIGSALTLTADTLAGYNGLVTYYWAGPNGYIYSNNSPSTVITPTTTATSGVYSLSVSYPHSGCISNIYTTPIISVNPVPVITSFASSTSYMCVGTQLTLTASSTGTGPLSHYSWSGPNGYNHISGSDIAYLTPTTTASSGVYSLTVTYDGAGCVSTVNTVPAVTVNTLPVITSFTNSSDNLCTGTPLTFNASGTGVGTFLSYNWTGPHSFTATTTSTIESFTTTTTAESGVYSVSISYSGTGCTSHSATTVPVTVNALPTVSGFSTSTTNICTGTPLTLSGTGNYTGAGTLVSYNWSGPNGYYTTNSGTTAVFTPTTTSASGFYSLTVTYTGTGCTSATYSSRSVTVNALPVVSGFTPSSTLICTGSPLTLSASSSFSGSGSLISYNWSGPNGYSNSNTGLTTVFTPTTTATSGIYSLSVTYEGTGCTSNISTTLPITVNNLPVVNTFTPSTNILCTGTPLTLSGSATGTGTLISYNWSGPGGFSTTNTGTSAVYTPSNISYSGVYSLSVTYTGTGCTSAQSTTAPITVNLTPAVINGTSIICGGGIGTSTFNDFTPGGTWSSTTPSIATISSTGNIVGYLPGTDIISYTLNNCTSTKTITVNTQPAPIAGSLSFCNLSTTSLSDVNSGGIWSSNDNIIATVSSTGVVTGNSVGNATITYIIGTCYTTSVITVNTTPSSLIGGSATLCNLATTTFSDGVMAGTWSTGNVIAATVDNTGVVTGSLSGSAPDTATIRYTIGNCVASSLITVNPQPGPILGNPVLCSGSTDLVTNSLAGGSWSSNDITIASIFPAGSSGGIISGITYGNTIITYSLNNCISTLPITVNQQPMPITGSSNTLCNYDSAQLSDPTAFYGSVWSSSNPTIVTVNTNGKVFAHSTGIDTISYTIANCLSKYIITVNPAPQAISGTMAMCEGQQTTLFDAFTGGNWSSSSASVATVNPVSGIVSGITYGNTLIYYTIGACTTSAIITVNISPAAITGIDSVCKLSTTSLSDTVVGGVWSSINSSIASVNSTGVVTGNSVGTTTISYTIGNCTATSIITVNTQPLPLIGADSVCLAATSTLSEISTGGIWSTANSGIASVSAGIVSGISVGTSAISYTIGKCTAVAVITVNPLPAYTTHDTITCKYAPATLNLGGNDNYSWIPATGLSCTNCATPIATPLSTTIYTITATSIHGCVKVKTLRDSVDKNKAVVFTGKDSVCLGSIDTLIASNNSSYVWLPATGLDCTTCSTVHARLNATQVYTLIGTDITGCTDTLSQKVNVVPLAHLTSTLSPHFICTGSSFSYLDSIDLTSASVRWWRNNVSGISPATSSGTNNISEILTVTNQRIDTATYFYQLSYLGCKDTEKVKLTVQPIPNKPSISTSTPADVCANTLYQNFGASSVEPAGIKYTWSASNATIWAEGTNRQFCIVNFYTSGKAIIYLTANYIGAQCSIQDSATISVSSSTSKLAKIVYDNHNFVCLENNIDTYQWGYDSAVTFGPVLLPGEILQNYYNPNPDWNNKFYWVKTTSSGCMQKSYYNAPTSITNVGNTTPSVKIYPNPANNYLNVEIDNITSNEMSIRIYEVTGKFIKSLPASNKTEINISDLMPGFYIISIYDNGLNIVSTKFIKGIVNK